MMLHNSALLMRCLGSGLRVLARSSVMLSEILAQSGILYLALDWSRGKLGSKGDLKNSKVNMMHPSEKMSTFSVIG